MLEIFILFKLGMVISHKAMSKGWPGVPFVIIMIALYFASGIAGCVLAIVVASQVDPNGEDGFFEGIIGFYTGAALGIIGCFLLVSVLPDRSEPEDEYDRPRRLRDRGDDYEDDLPRARRERGDDDDDRDDDRDVPRARRDDDGDWRRR